MNQKKFRSDKFHFLTWALTFVFLLSGPAVAQVFVPFGFWQKVIVAAANYAPTISTIANRNIYEGNYPYIPFTIQDLNDAVSCSVLHLSATSSNTTVVPVSNITFTGTAPFCFVNIVPAAGQTGASSITITVNDNNVPNLQASTTFTVTAFIITGISVLPQTAIIPKNTTFQYVAMANFSDATTQDVSSSVTWTENTANTTISTSGLLTVDNAVVGNPALTVTATYGIYSGTANATLNASTVTAVFTTPVSATINPGTTKNVKCYATTADGGTIDVTSTCVWTSSNNLNAPVNDYYPKGLVSGITNGGPYTITASFGGFSDTTAITVAETAPTEVEEGIGLFARYFTGMSFQTFFRQRVDSTVDFSWNLATNPVGGADSYSARWTGQVLAPETGTYTFHTYSDDGFRLWVNDTLINDYWTNHGAAASAATNIVLTAGVKYNILVEHYENTGNSWARLAWKVPSSGCANFAGCPIVPRANLFPDSGSALPILRPGNSDTNPGNRNFLNDGLIRHYSADGTGSISNGATITAQVETGGAGGGTLTATNTNGTGLSYGTGLIAQGFSFDGVDDVLSSANTGLQTGTAVRSFSMWLRPNDVGANQGVFFYGANTNLNGNGLILTADRRVRVHGGGADTCDTAINLINWNDWNFIALRFAGAGGNVTVYVNGVETSCGNKAWNTSAGGLTLGSNPSVAQLFSGILDEFTVWNANIATNNENHLPRMLLQRQNPTPSYSP